MRRVEDRRPTLRPIEQTLFVLMSNPGRLIEVDRWPHEERWYPSNHRANNSGASPICMSLRRRGCYVSVGRVDDEWVALAMWDHDVPTEVAS